MIFKKNFFGLEHHGKKTHGICEKCWHQPCDSHELGGGLLGVLLGESKFWGYIMAVHQ